MFKTLKKAVAVVLVLVFAMSLLPGMALAETTAVTVNFINGVKTRSSAGNMTNEEARNCWWGMDDYYGTPVLTTGGSYRGFAQLDFTGYEAILANDATTINYNVVAGGFSSTVLRDLIAYIQPGSVDTVYDASALTYNMANSYGMLDTADKPILYIESDGAVTSAGGVVTGEADIEALRTALNEDPVNSVVTIYFHSLVNGDNVIRFSKSSGIVVNYDESTIDNQAYLTDVVSGMSWDKISSQAADAIVSDLDLPSKYMGADVVWTSSNPDALNADTGDVNPLKGESQTTTLTATLTYNGVVGQEATATTSFDLTISEVELSKITVPDSKAIEKAWTRGGSHEENVQAVSYGGYSIHNSPTWLTNDRQTYFRYDLSGYEKYLKIAKNVNFTLTGGSNQSTSGKVELTILSSKSDTIWNSSTLTHKYSNDTGMKSESGCASLIFDIGQNVSFSSQEFGQGFWNELVQNPTNATATLRFNGAPGYTTEMALHWPLLTMEIEYYEDELSDEDFVADVKGGLLWEYISDQNPTAIYKDINLPSTYYGFPVTWTSSNESVISTAGAVTVSDTQGYNVKLTAAIDYGTTAETVEFDVAVPKKMVNLEYMYDGSLSLGEVGVVSTVEANGLGGKSEYDSYINYANISEDYYGHSLDNAGGNDDVFEFSALVPDGAKGMHMYIGIFSTTGVSDSTRMTLPFTVKTDGLYYGYTGYEYRIVAHDATEWTNYAIVAPKGMTGSVDSAGNSLDDSTYEVYINGIKVFEHEAQITLNGIAYIRFYTYSDNADDTTIYFDNVRAYSGEYNPSYDTVSSVETSYGIVDKKIMVTDTAATLGEVIGNITVDEDAVIRAYNAQDERITDYSQLAIGNKLVIADRNGTTLERSYITYEICYNAGEDVVFGDPKLSYANGGVKASISAYNYTANEERYQVYVAVYEDGELTELNPQTLTVPAGETATAGTTVRVNSTDTVKLFAWSMDNLKPMTLPAQYN